MQFDTSNFNLDSPNSPEFWLIVLTYLGFWLYSCYSLVVFLIHLHRQNSLLEHIEPEEN